MEAVAMFTAFSAMCWAIAWGNTREQAGEGKARVAEAQAEKARYEYETAKLTACKCKQQ